MPALARIVFLLCLAALAGCGADDEKDAATMRTSTTTAAAPQPRGPVPPALRTVESAAEDTIDHALAGDRAKAVRTANALVAAADGPAKRALTAAGVGRGPIQDLHARSAEVARLAPKGELLAVALAANHAFELVPGFFARYQTRVPARVQTLDYLDFEAKLRARAHDDAQLRAAAEALRQEWGGLRPGVVRAGGARPAAAFDAHVRRLTRLAGGSAGAEAAREAQHGLDLVDELEAVYER
ncbi:MAG TPA: hypothetical protein VGP78_09305 [Solirubrobacteraceae bacterium]|nr:hypothetical protein [Solirubrobacteraceae bacterium]